MRVGNLGVKEDKMSRNLCRSSCCGYTLRLEDLRGKPIEFRRYSNSPPVLGTKWTCQNCGTMYFAIWRNAIWGTYPYNDWVRGFVIDLSYYESYNDEHDYEDGKIVGIDSPRHLCLDNAEDRQTVW